MRSSAIAALAAAPALLLSPSAASAETISTHVLDLSLIHI